MPDIITILGKQGPPGAAGPVGPGATDTELSVEFDLDQTGPVNIIIALADTFFPNEVGLIITALDGTLISQPIFSIGITGNLTKYRDTEQATALDLIRKRETINMNTDETGESGINNTNFILTIDTAGVKNTATVYKGKFYARGIKLVL